MTATATSDVPVLVVGAGPVGLTMACQLRRHGVDCQVIDAEEGPTPPHESRALGIHSRTLEVFDDMGLIHAILERGRPLRAVNAYDRGRRVARFELDFDGLGAPYPMVLSLSQGETERLLIDLLTRLGGTVQWRTRLTDLRADDQGVTAVLASDGRESHVRAGWLVGCDGAGSQVRKCLEIGFEGTAYEDTFLLADAQMNWQLAPDEGHVLLTSEGILPMIPLPEEGCWRLIDPTGAADASDTRDPAAIAERFRSLLDQANVPDTSVDRVIWTSAFRIQRRTVDHLRVGRCFLAGDAAHIHSPVGGQGMNIGIQDSYNLAWKLALAITQAAPETLLDSYQAERLAIATTVSRATDWATRVATLRNPVARAVRNQIVSFITSLGFVRRRMTRNLSQLGMNYRRSPLVAGDAGLLASGPKPGDRVPDFPLPPSADGPNRLFDLLRGTHHTLLLFEGTKPTPADRDAIDAITQLLRNPSTVRIVPYRVVHVPDELNDDSPAVAELVRVQAAPVRVPDKSNDDSSADISTIPDGFGQLHRRFAARSASVYLIRPDGYVGYRSHRPNAVKFAAYVSRAYGW